MNHVADGVAGGVQPYLKYIYGDVFGFLAAWTWVVAMIPAALAIMSIVFVESIYSALGVTGQGDGIEHKLLSIMVLVLIGLANSINTKTSTRLNNFFVATKFVMIAAVVLAGTVVVILQLADPNREVGGRDWVKKPWFGYRDSINPDGSITHWAEMGQWDMFGHLSTALYAALWAYSGWDKVTGQPIPYGLSNADHDAAHLYFGRAFGPGPPVATCDQHLPPLHHSLLHRSKCRLLHLATLGRGFHDG